MYIPRLDSDIIWAGEGDVAFLRHVIDNGYVGKPSDGDLEKALQGWIEPTLKEGFYKTPPNAISYRPSVDYLAFLLSHNRNPTRRLAERICRRAVELDDLPLVTMLQERLPASMHPQNVYGHVRSSEMWALIYGDIPLAQAIYQHHYILDSAVRWNDIALARKILSVLDQQPATELERYLTLAVENGHVSMARMFLEAGAGVGGLGQSMQKALMEGHDKVVELLLSRGLNIASVDRRVWDTCRERGFQWIVEKFQPAGAEEGGSFDPRTPLRFRDVVTGDFMVACAEDGSPWCVTPAIVKVSMVHGDIQLLSIAQYKTPPAVFRAANSCFGPSGRKLKSLKSTDILPVDTFGRHLGEGQSGKLYDPDAHHFFRLYHADMVFTRRKQADGKFLRGWAYVEEITA